MNRLRMIEFLKKNLLPKGSHFFNGTKDDAKLSRSIVCEGTKSYAFIQGIYKLFLTQYIQSKLSEMRSNCTPSFTIMDGRHRRPKILVYSFISYHQY